MGREISKTLIGTRCIKIQCFLQSKWNLLLIGLLAKLGEYTNDCSLRKDYAMRMPPPSRDDACSKLHSAQKLVDR
ncbi:hypothetical protein PG996_013161 [Apiospora saccharicola]|uniref:Uncharacterized protein n=1 Tax=Apiospora saccharicola TaxID=335842 RepID=A0ABR1U4P4_9PEZI